MIQISVAWLIVLLFLLAVLWPLICIAIYASLVRKAMKAKNNRQQTIAEYWKGQYLWILGQLDKANKRIMDISNQCRSDGRKQ